MFKKRHWLILLGLFVFQLFFLTPVSAVDSTFLLTPTYISPSPTDNFTVAIFPTDTTFALTFNLSNLTDNTIGANTDEFNLTNNLTVKFIMPNGTEVEVARNFTSSGFFIPFLSGTNLDNIEWAFDFTVALNTTILPDQEGSYIVNITVEVYNSSGYMNGSQTFTGLVVTINNAAPDTSLKFTNTINKEATQFPATDTVKIVCTRSAVGSNYNYTNITIMAPDSSGQFDLLSEDFTRSTSEAEFTVEFKNTRTLGDYLVLCMTIDDAGLVNDTVNKTFTVVKKIPSGSSPFVNPDYKPPVGTILIGAGSTSDLGVLTEEGVSRQMAKTATASVTVDDKSYSFFVKDFTDSSAVYTLQGEKSFDITVAEQETKNVDVTGDGTDDMSITLHQVYNKKADTTFKLLTLQQAPKSPEGEKKEVTQQSSTETTTISSGWGLVVGIFIIVLFVLGALHYFGARRRRGGAHGSNGAVRFTPRDLGLQRPPDEPRTFTRY